MSASSLGGYCHTLPGQTPPSQTPHMQTPPGQTLPGRHPTGQTEMCMPGYTPSAQCMMGYTPLLSACWDVVNKWAVHIPLECILVRNWTSKFLFVLLTSLFCPVYYAVIWSAIALFKWSFMCLWCTWRDIPAFQEPVKPYIRIYLCNVYNVCNNKNRMSIQLIIPLALFFACDQFIVQANNDIYCIDANV